MWFLDHQLFSFVVGVFFGAFVIVLAISMHLGTILSKKAKEFDKKTAVDFAKIQEKLREKNSFLFTTAEVFQKNLKILNAL